MQLWARFGPKRLVPKNHRGASLEEAAAATGYSKTTIEAAIRNNDLESSYANSQPVVLARELHGWLASLPHERP